MSRRWTDGLRREVKGRDQQYLDLLLVRSNSREYVDSIAGMTQAQVHRAAMLFCNADLDGDGALQLDEFRRHLVARFGARFSGDVVFEALCRKADLNQDGLIDFNEWLVFNETRVGGMTFGRVKGGLLDESVAADAMGARSSSSLGDLDLGAGCSGGLDMNETDATSTQSAALQLQSRGVYRDLSQLSAASVALPPAASAAALRVLAVVKPAEADEEQAVALARAATLPPPVQPDYLRMLLARSSGSRAVVDELRTEHATELPEDVLQAAAAFVAMEGDERNALLTLDQFETALVGHSMAAGDAEAATVKRVRQMFAKADLNKDGFVDFNEFVAMRRLTQEHHRKLEGKHSHEPSYKAKGTGGTSLPQAEVGSWVKCVLTEKEVEGANERRAKEAQAHTLAKRVAVDDSLQDLSADDLQTLREEILTTSARLDAGACRVTLGMLAMRVGKMFTPAEVDSFVNELVRARGDGSGRIAPEQLISGLRVNVRASK